MLLSVLSVSFCWLFSRVATATLVHRNQKFIGQSVSYKFRQSLRSGIFFDNNFIISVTKIELQ